MGGLAGPMGGLADVLGGLGRADAKEVFAQLDVDNVRARVISDSHFSVQLNHFIPGFYHIQYLFF